MVSHSFRMVFVDCIQDSVRFSYGAHTNMSVEAIGEETVITFKRTIARSGEARFLASGVKYRDEAHVQQR